MNAVTAIGVLAAIALLEPAPQERFRTSAEAVRVDVLVKIGNRPLAGLTAADFNLRDRGIPQRIDSVTIEDVPLSVMIALDTSDSVKGQALQDLREAAAAAARLLRPDDPAALLTFSHRLSLRTPWTRDHAQIGAALQNIEPEGATSLHDVAYAALILKDDQPGRALVLLFSDGHDTASWLPGVSVIEAAPPERSRCVCCGPDFAIRARARVSARLPIGPAAGNASGPPRNHGRTSFAGARR